MPAWVLALADDLTGALETAAKFAAQGIAAQVTTDPHIHQEPRVPVLVIDTETRHLSPDEARRRVRDVATEARPFSPWLIYKKTDSTLRGHIAAEFQALLGVFPERELCYAPAYPEMGRTAREGRLYVHNVPVHETDFARDSLNPVFSSEFATLLAGVPAVIHHGETNTDVDNAARAILRSQRLPLCAGPAALAQALAVHLDLPRNAPPPLPQIARCLVINGSQHPVSHSQIAAYAFDRHWQYFSPDTTATGEARAQQTGEQVRALLANHPVQAIVVFGGDTAFGIHRALGSPAFEALTELVPGVPLSRANGLFWITKAGGFGGPGILCDIQKRLT